MIFLRRDRRGLFKPRIPRRGEAPNRRPKQRSKYDTSLNPHA
jgi:hypothetical protein